MITREEKRFLDALQRLVRCARGDHRFSEEDEVTLLGLIDEWKELTNDNIELGDMLDFYSACEETKNQYKMALDKACKQMENCICAITRDGRYWTSKDWKEWCLKDE